MTGFSAYMGDSSMYEVHKYVISLPGPALYPHIWIRAISDLCHSRFMVLDPYQLGYFITQVGLSAASFGVAESDISAVAMALESLFAYRCAPKMIAIEAQGPQYQSVCTDETCPLAANFTCADQPSIDQPLVANSTLAMGEGRNASSSAVAPSSSSMSSGSSTGSASGTSSGIVPVQTKSAGLQLSPRMEVLLGLLIVAAFAF